MKTNFIALFASVFLVQVAFSQPNLNNYKYVIVPKKFDFLKDPNQYRLNELAKFLFEKNGFMAIMEGEDYPEDLTVNRCLALRSDVLKDSGLFKTKLNIELKDCNDSVVYTSQTGESREKDYAVAYNEAIRNAFEWLESLNYQYEPNENVAAIKSIEKPKDNSNQAEIAELRAEIESLKQEKELVKANTAEINDDADTFIHPKFRTKKPVVSEKSNKALEVILYAQATNDGYQLVDKTPKVVYKLIKTGISDLYLVENLSAIIYKKGDLWVLEHHNGNTLINETLHIKF